MDAVKNPFKTFERMHTLDGRKKRVPSAGPSRNERAWHTLRRSAINGHGNLFQLSSGNRHSKPFCAPAVTCKNAETYTTSKLSIRPPGRKPPKFCDGFHERSRRRRPFPNIVSRLSGLIYPGPDATIFPYGFYWAIPVSAACERFGNTGSDCVHSLHFFVFFSFCFFLFAC